ncbi:MAG: hypothetical protein RL708_699 [Bacteroidota bacterium]|jgi:hypothetical protein
MKLKSTEIIISDTQILERIFVIRGQKVMLDRDLAEMYGVKTMILNQSVKRNLKRFPEDFMFQLSKEEWESLRSQIVILEVSGRGQFPKYLPYAFTEQGVAMLSSVLKSDRAIEVNIQIIRLFTKMKEFILEHKDLYLKLEQLEFKFTSHDRKMKTIFDYLNKLLQQEVKPRTVIEGFKKKK